MAYDKSAPDRYKDSDPIPERYGEYLIFKYKDIVADAGYESEENYLFIEENGQVAFIKPANYEISQTRKYQNDISEKDVYTCSMEQTLTAQYNRTEKTATGYRRTTTVYKCSNCNGCNRKNECIKGNNCKTPIEERNKILYVSKTMKQKRAEDFERITSKYGTQLRMNRSIQA